MQPHRKSEPSAAERLEAELATLSSRRRALAADVERLAAREEELTEADLVTSAMGATKAARNRLKAIDSQIAETRGRLEVANGEARTNLLAELLAEWEPAARDFVVKAWAAQEALARAISAREALQAAAFRDEYRSIAIPPSINGSALLAPDLLKAFEAGLRPPPRTAPFSALRPMAPPRTAPRPEPRPTPPPLARPSHRETAAEGERLYVAVRSGAELPRKGQLRVGDIVSLTDEEAVPLLRTAALDTVRAEEVGDADAFAAGQTPLIAEVAE